MCSQLLRQREFLQIEIGRGMKLLQQWHEGAEDHPGGGRDKTCWLAGPSDAILLPDQVMHHFLTAWVDRLQQALESVTCQIGIESTAQPRLEAEESMFALLRGAG